MTLDTLTFTLPDSFPAEGRCDSVGGPELGTLGARLERLSNDSFAWIVVDSISGKAPGSRDSFIVDLTGCAPCAYRVWCVDAAGNVSCFPSNVVNKWEGGAPVGVSGNAYPFRLDRAKPTPVIDRASIAFSLPRAGEARLEVYDIAGRRVRTLVSGQQAAGPHLAFVQGLTPGVYVVRLQFGGRTLSNRMAVLR